MNSVGLSVDATRTEQDVLTLNAIENLLRCNPQRGQLLMRKLDVDSLRLFTNDVDLFDIRNAKQLLAS